MAAPSTIAQVRDVFPKLGEISDKVVFGDVWERKQLSKRDRSLITVAALTALYRPDQLRGHLHRAFDNGVTQGGDHRGDHAPLVLCRLAERRHRGADRQGSVQGARRMKIGFIGLGAMGRPMAANLQRAGHAVQVHDLRRVEGFPNWKASAAEAAAGLRAALHVAARAGGGGSRRAQHAAEDARGLVRPQHQLARR